MIHAGGTSPISSRAATVLGFCGYDFHNVGDDAFMMVLADQALRLRGCRDLRLTSSYLPEEISFDGITTIYSGMPRIRGAHIWRVLRYGTHIDTLVFFGGSVLHEKCKYGLLTAQLRVLKKLNRGLQIGGLGVSIGPFFTASQKERLANYLGLFDYVSVRDKESFRFLRGLKVQCRLERRFDLAALLLDTPQGEKLCRKPERVGTPLLLGIAPCDFRYHAGLSPSHYSASVRRLVDALQRLSDTLPVRLRLFEFNGARDRGDQDPVDMIMKALANRCNVEICRYHPNPIHYLEKVAECTVMLAVRLHSAVFSFLAEVPIVMLSYHPKCTGFAEEIGLSQRWIFDIQDFQSQDLALALAQRFEDSSPPSLPLSEARASASLQVQEFFGPTIPSV